MTPPASPCDIARGVLACLAAAHGRLERNAMTDREFLELLLDGGACVDPLTSVRSMSMLAGLYLGLLDQVGVDADAHLAELGRRIAAREAMP